MPRFSPNIVAAFAAAVITVASLHAITIVPAAQAAVLTTPFLA